ncbi:ATG13 [Cordylochernes scorpioides]|uniref:Autophagy-related protein 13 n=1 Tax=Cordylochernes scorpioides TaxID=51811 RepID=A0ABY6JZN8_9ARAC|nr:ATG13 [Cordylochernes scorpioides]
MATSDAKNLSKQDLVDFQKFIKHLGLKSIQIIVQSRLGKKNCTRSKPDSIGANWFNLALQDCPEVMIETKKAIGDCVPSQNSPLCIEISLKTVENTTLILEIWKLYITGNSNINSIHYVYNRMSIVLKSLMCITKITPAYKFSCLQGPESHVICYRVFMGEPDYNVLGDHVEHFKVGCVSTPLGGVGISLAYRTVLQIDPQPITPPLLVTSNYFDKKVNVIANNNFDDIDSNKNDSPISEKGHEDLMDSKSKLNATCINFDYESSTVWENSKVGAFAPSIQPPKLDDDYYIPDTPFNHLFQHNSTANSATDLNNNSGSSGSTKVEKKPTKSNDSDSDQSVTDDFVLVDLKPPFAEASFTSIGTFFNDLPPLLSFNQDVSLEEQVSEMSSKIELYESDCIALDNFVDSLCQLDEN